MKHVVIYRQPGRYAGWPANYHIHSWGDEIVLGFTSGYHTEFSKELHSRDKSKPFETLQARSPDGGESWQIEPFPGKTPGNKGVSADEHMEEHLQAGPYIDTGPHAPRPLSAPLDFTAPEFVLMCARSHLWGGARSWFYTSVDRARTWEGPWALPMFGQPGIQARTDYQVLGRRECLLFLTASTETEQGSRVFCAGTRDGGMSFEIVNWITDDSGAGHSIMPASVRLPPTGLLVATRERRRDADGAGVRNWIDLYGSDDNGLTWTYKGRPVPDNGSNPPTLTRLLDGRLCMTYGCRKEPFGIRAKLSADDGESWGEEIILRDDGGSADLGYPRTVQRPDGTIVTTYYFNDRHRGACYIAATLWTP